MSERHRVEFPNGVVFTTDNDEAACHALIAAANMRGRQAHDLYEAWIDPDDGEGGS